jgi:hypothetical protein
MNEPARRSGSAQLRQDRDMKERQDGPNVGRRLPGRFGSSISVTSYVVAKERDADSTAGNLAQQCRPDELAVVVVQLESF